MTIEPQIGVVNITEDSFSDGGRYVSCEAATRYAFELVDAGADVVELGPASTHPSAQSVPLRKRSGEWRALCRRCRNIG